MERVNSQGSLFDKDPEQKMPKDIQKTIQTCINLIRATSEMRYYKESLKEVLQNYSEDVQVSKLIFSDSSLRELEVAKAYKEYMYICREQLAHAPIFRRYMDDFFSRRLPKKPASKHKTAELFSGLILNRVKKEGVRRARIEVERAEHKEWLAGLDRRPLSKHPDDWRGELAEYELSPQTITVAELRRDLPDRLSE